MILTINCGSSSLKYQLYSSDLTRVVAKGMVSRIGETGAHIDHSAGRERIHQDMVIADHGSAFRHVIDNLLHPEWGALTDIGLITAVGHRAVHGGDTFVDSVLVTDAVLRQLEACTPLAPLHNPANLLGIEEARRLLPDVPHVVVFDTSFHQTMPPSAHVYGLPYRFYGEHKIRRYGFHGTSCRYVSGLAGEILGRPVEDLRLVVCHLGNGVTIDAVAGGRSVDTSMGFGTFSGVMMGTRAGDFDPGLIFHLHSVLKLDMPEIERICYKESGLLGISGVSNDMRDVVAAADAGNERCALAVDMFVHMVRKQVGAFAAVMGGIDALVFTAGIGENSPYIRARIAAGLEFLGVEIDAQANADGNRKPALISPAGARTAVLVAPTDEEMMIARDTVRLAGSAHLLRLQDSPLSLLPAE
ncbi:acetate/propionate family kinase [Oleisolibacter albus]|uniref:acetate/propionate family kinase n=1 Tax=Oleisolibacter albus TaxID=2171757 RepID=UPI000DF317CA|nr:acetate kinase [Oleisolibacter albus]